MLMIQNLPTENWTDSEIGMLVAEAYKLKFTFADAPNHLQAHDSRWPFSRLGSALRMLMKLPISRRSFYLSMVVYCLWLPFIFQHKYIIIAFEINCIYWMDKKKKQILYILYIEIYTDTVVSRVSYCKKHFLSLWQ